MTTAIINTTDASFQQDVLASDTPVVLDFWAQWCGPCKNLSPVLDELSCKYEGKVKVVKVDTEKNPKLCKQYNVRGIPHVLLVDKGEIVQDIGNFRSVNHLSTLIDGYLNGLSATGSLEANLDDLAFREEFLLQGDIDRVKAYLVANPNVVNEPLQRGAPPISMAIAFKLQERIDLLLTFNPALSFSDNVALGNIEPVKEVITRHPEYLNPTGERENSPLVPAVAMKQRAMAEMLLDAGADVNWQNSVGSYVVLQGLLSDNDVETMKWLMTKGLNIKVIMRGNNTALHIAGYQGHFEMTQFLLEQGLDPKAKNEKGDTPLAFSKVAADKRTDGQKVIELLEQY